MATLTWVGDVPGAGNNVLWGANNAGNTNWSGNVLPADGDTLVFDGTGATFALTNDIAGLDNITLQFTDAVAGDYSIAGDAIGLAAAGITSNVTTGTGVTITAPLELDAATVAVTSTAGELSLEGGISGANTLNILAGGGTVAISGGVDVSAVTSAEDTTVSGLIETTGSQSYSGILTLADDAEFRATGAAASLTFTGQIVAGANDLTLTAREINLPAVANTVSGTASITLQPEANATPINIGAAADAGGASLDITAADIAALSGGFTQITIGRAAGTATITVAAAGASFGDAVTLRATGVGASIALNGALDTTADGDAGAIVLDGPSSTTTLNADIITAGAPITISDAIILGAAATITLDTTNGGAVAAGEDITLTGPGTVNDDAAGTSTLILRAGAGDIVVDDAVGASVAIAALTVVSAEDVNFNGTLRTTGDVTQQAGTGLTELNGTSGTGIGGNLSIVTNEILLDAAAVVTVGNVTLTAQNAITLNAPLNAGAGTITIAANQDGAETQNFQMNAGSSITTTNDTATAVSITVNTAGGGTGNANLRGISAGTTAGPAGGRITIAANAGAIVDIDASAAVNLTAGNAILTAAGGVGTIVEPLETTLGRLAANSGNPIRIVETNGLILGGIAGGLGITTSSDDVRLAVGGDLAIDDDINLVAGSLLLEVTGNVSQNAGDTITANRLALDVTGTTTLAEANSVAFLAADTGDTIDYTDASGLTVDAATILGATITGLTTSSDDVLLTTGGDLVIDADISLGAGSLLLTVTGNVSQNAGDTIAAAGLALDVTGTTTLPQANSVATLAADTGGTIEYTDANGLTIGSVTVLGTPITGITTSNDDVRFTTGGDLVIDEGIALGAGDLLLAVTGNVSQNAGDTIVAAGLALDVSGTTTLTEANSVTTLAADADGTIDYTDATGLTVGSVTVLGTTITGITTSGDDVRLTTGGDLVIDEDANVGGGDLLLDVTGNVLQNAGDTIVANGLAVVVDGTTTLTQANNVAIIAANNGGTIDYNDTNALTIGSVTVLATTITGLTTSNDDVRITTGGDLVIDEDVSVGGGDLLLDVAGDVSQSAGDTITAAGLALVVDGTTTLTLANNVATIAANNGGTIDYTDSNALTVGAVTALGTTITGITTSGDDVRLTTGGDLVIDEDIALGAGDLLLTVTGNVSQNAGDTIAATGLALDVSGTTTLTQPNDVATLAADTDGTIDYNDTDGLTIGSVTVLVTTITGLTTSSDDVRITAGGSLVIDEDVNLSAGDLLLDIAGNVSQNAGDTITAAGLALVVDGTTTLTLANNVATIAANNGGTIDYTDTNSLTVGAVTVLAQTVTGISTSDDEVRLTVGTTAGNDLAIIQPINVNPTAAAGGDLMLDVGGNVTQTPPGTIVAEGLALIVDGSTTLTLAGNDVDTLAADNGGEICFVDADDLAINAVTVFGVTVTGVQTNDADIEIVAGTSITLVQTLSAGTADVRLAASTFVSQLATGNIVADELGVRAGTGIGLSAAIATNDVNELAAFSTAGAILYGDRDDLTVGSVTAGVCGFLATTGVNAQDGNVQIEVRDTAAAGENLIVAADVLAGTLPTDNDRSLTLLAGDDLTINSGINVLATGAVTIAADTHTPLADAGVGATITILGTTGKIAGDLAAGNDVTITLGGDNDTVFLAPDRFDVNAGSDAVPAYASNQMFVSLGGGDDRITLDYSANFGWSGPKMELNIDAGTGSDTLDIDQTDDARARKRQFVYATGQPADGTATNFTSDVQSTGGTYDNNDNLCVMIRQMDGYLVRAGSASLDQTILIGNQTVSNEITVGDIDGTLPAIITSPQFTGQARFGVSGSELLRSIGGGLRDTIFTGVTPASGVNRNIIEGQGSTVAGEGELLRGAANIVNLFFGAGAVPLIGQAGANLDIGLEPERARLIGGAGDGALGDYYLADHRRVINADGTAAAPLQVAGGDFRDLEMGARSTAVSFGANDRAKAGGSVAGSGPVSIFMNGQINVILWLQARFPGFAELGSVTGDGTVTGSAESLVAAYDHNFLTCDGQPQTTINQGPGGGGGGPGPVANNVTATVSSNKLTLTGDASANDIVITLGVSGPNSVRIEGRNGTTINGGAAAQVFTGLSKGILAKLSSGADRVLVEGSGFTPLVRIEGSSGNDEYTLKMTGASLEIVDPGGWDRLNLSQLSTKATLSLSSTSTQSFGASSKLKFSGTIEDLIGTQLDDTLTGNSAANNIFGLAGNDTIYGKDGNDYIDGGEGNDTLRGENHNDFIRGGNDNDKIYGGSGHDILLGELGTDELRGDSGRDLLIGGLDLDVLYGGSDEDIVTGGTTSHDANDTALKALLAEWIKSGSTTSRANKLRTGQTVGNFALNLSEVQLDGQIDSLRGEGSNDWLLAPLADNDTLVSVTSGDIVDR